MREQLTHAVDDIVRGLSGGFLFAMPLLYTMEVWWIGTYLKPGLMLLILGLTFGLVFLLNQTAGFRRVQPTRLIDGLVDTVEAMGIAVVCATLILLLLRRITFETSLNESLGKIVLETLPVALGVAISNQYLSSSRQDDPGKQSDPKIFEQKQALNATIADFGATLIGAGFIAFSIAPTEEIPMLVAAMSHPRLLMIMAVSLLLSYSIVFTSGFSDQQKRAEQQGLFQQPLSETIMAYLVSLFAAALMLWLFHQVSFADPWYLWLSYSIVLGLPAAIGGAAGRLAV